MNTENIRNFVIISHIDHGKSTLADRFLELTKTIETRKMRSQFLDSMELERERGITIKMAPIQMLWRPPKHLEARSTKHEILNSKLEFTNPEYILNLIDTPGHVDFSYEVSRALAAVEGAILLVDATKGIQAQTLAHLHQAQRQELIIIPAINKIDSPAARIEETAGEIEKILPGKKVFLLSAKKGTGVKELLEEVIKTVPAPKIKREGYSRALIFDSQYDSFRGVLAYVKVVEGKFSAKSKIMFLAKAKTTEAVEVGFFKPQPTPAKEISEGCIGYIATGLKAPEVVQVGDTIVVVAPNNKTPSLDSPSRRGGQITNYKSLPGYQKPVPVVFASIFPSKGIDMALFKDAFLKLKLSDWALSFEAESSEVLGRGFRCGFLGSLHLEIVLERLRREFNLSFVATTPSVSYRILRSNNEIITIYNPSEFPENGMIKEVSEPWVKISVFTPANYLGDIIKLTQKKRGIKIDTNYLSTERVELIYEIPLAEIIVDFYDQLKSVSSGFASLSYEPIGWRSGNLVKLDILVAGEKVEALAKIVPRERAYNEGKALVERLKKLLPRQLFAVSLQAALGSKIIARQTLSALKKDVTGHLYGGDITRKRKLWKKQKRGKKKLKERGRVNIPDRVFVEMLKISSKT